VSRAAVVVLALTATLAAAAPTKGPGARGATARWGITPVSVRPAAGGNLLYFRYRVVDAKRAKPLFDKSVRPRLVDRQTGAVAKMPEDTRLGALRSSPRTTPVNGKEYYVLFANHTGVKSGGRVDVSLGDCTLRDLVVADP
jgi:hypothetical protein